MHAQIGMEIQCSVMYERVASQVYRWKVGSLRSNDFYFILFFFFFHISTVDSVMIIRLCNFSLEQGKNDLTTVISTDDF